MKVTQTEKHGTKVWRVNFVENGVQRRRFFHSEKAAGGFVSSKEKEQAKVGHVIAAMQPQETAEMLALWLAVKKKGVPVSALLEAATRKPTTQISVRDAVDACIKAKVEARIASKRYQKQLRHTLGDLAKAFAATPLCDMEHTTLFTWATRNGALSKWTSRSRLTDVRTLFSFAKRQGWVVDNPCDRMESVPVGALEPGVLRVKAASKLMRGAERRDPELCCWLALSLFCGIRPAELQRLSPANIDQDRRITIIPNSAAKTARRRIVKIPDNAIEWMALSGSGPNPRNLKRRFDRLRKRLGIFNSWPHDAMRHSAASYHLALYENAPMTALEMGHSVPVLMTHYRALVTKEQAQRFFEIRPQSSKNLSQAISNRVMTPGTTTIMTTVHSAPSTPIPINSKTFMTVAEPTPR